MKVYLTNYRDHWLSPYVIIEKIVFWKDWDNIDYDDEPWIKKWNNRLAPLCEALKKFLDFVHPQISYVKIDRYDTWNFDHSLAKIIVPGLKQLRDTKMGSPVVDLADVPEHLRYTNREDYDAQYSFDFYHEDCASPEQCDVHARWNWVLNEMIFAFEAELRDWSGEFYSGEADYIFIPVDKDGKECTKEESKLRAIGHGPNHTYKWDMEGHMKMHERIQNGFRLFGKYYQGLWD
jgi:hypothetical protein